MDAKRLAKQALAASLRRGLGRRGFARLARFLNDQARLDGENRPEHNGETVLQAAVVGCFEGPIVAFDVGAHVGQWTRSLLAQCDRLGRREAVVHAFEPCSSTLEIFRTALAPEIDAKRVVLNALALSDQRGQARFNVVGDGIGTNSLHAQTLDIERVEQVYLDTVDQYCAERGIERIHLLKIDAEGHDLHVLRGARGLLECGAIEIAQFEYNHRWIFSRHFLKDAFELLTPFGYRMGKVTPLGVELYDAWHQELERFREGNYVALRPEWIGRLPTLAWWGG